MLTMLMEFSELLPFLDATVCLGVVESGEEVSKQLLAHSPQLREFADVLLFVSIEHFDNFAQILI
jgi:hypothetical protein